MTPSDKTVLTGDLLHPTATRTAGVRPWVWYAIIAALAIVAAVYLTSAFYGAPAGLTPQAHSATTQVQNHASDSWNYDGKPVDAMVRHLHGPANMQFARDTNAAAGGNGSAAAGSSPAPDSAQSPLPTVNAARAAYGTIVQTTGGETVPDTTGSQWGTRPYPLPSPAPGQGTAFRFPSGVAGGGDASTTPGAGHIQVVYGSTPTADTDASATARDVAPAADPPLPAAPNGGGLAGYAIASPPAMREPPQSKYVVSAGTRICAQLDVMIESDVPGPVTAHTTCPVLDALTGETLIPAGSVVIGDYSGLAAGQSRLSIFWKTLRFPDRSTLALDKAPALGEEGQVGVPGRLDDHRGQLFRSTFIGAILATIFQRLTGTNAGSSNVYVVSSPSSTSTSASAQMIYDLANRLNNQTAQLPVTISVGASSPIEIYVDHDIPFAGPYRPMQAVGV
jgi:type IV secretory pathway VirB10-like protein